MIAEASCWSNVGRIVYLAVTTVSSVVANGIDADTAVKVCMRRPVVSIAGDRPIIEAVRLMKDEATRHLAVTQDNSIIGVISVSNILRYYSGVV